MDDLAAAVDRLPLDDRPIQVLIVAGSGRRLDGCPGRDGKARALMNRMIGKMPPGWQTDFVDIGNEHGKPKIQGCNGCVSSSMALCVWPCNCYGPNSTTRPDLLWNEKLYQRLARADAWAFIGPVWWYAPSTNLKTLFDRLVCMSGGNPRPDLIDKKSTLKAQALERSPLWRELTKNHLEGRTAGFFCYGNDGANELDEDGRPRVLQHKQWFDPENEALKGEQRKAYQGLVWQCRYSGIEVPDHLWTYARIGFGRAYADDQAEDMIEEVDAMTGFDSWVASFVDFVRDKGIVPGTTEAERGAKSTTNM